MWHCTREMLIKHKNDRISPKNGLNFRQILMSSPKRVLKLEMPSIVCLYSWERFYWMGGSIRENAVSYSD